MTSRRSSFFLVVFLSLLGSFLLLKSVNADSTGAISAVVKWDTTTPSYSIPTFKLKFVGNTTGFTLDKFDNPNSIGVFNTDFVLPPDSYTVTVYRYQIGVADNYGALLANQTVNVSAGQTADINFDLSSNTGLVQGGLTINGNPSSGYIQFCGSSETDSCTSDFNINNNPFDFANGAWSRFDADGFNMPILPGNYRAHVITENRASVGVASISVVAGQIIADSSLQFSISFGSISGTVTWGTENLQYSLVNSPMLSVKFVGSNTGFVLWKFDDLSHSGSFNTGPALPSDTYTVSLYKYQAFAPDDAGVFLGDQTVAVGAGQSVSSNFDLENNTGLVRGSATINGTPMAGYIQFCSSLQTDPCEANTDINNPPFNRNNGAWSSFDVDGFSIPVSPGSYRVHVITSSRSEVGIISITVSAGQINTNSTFSVNLGGVSGIIKWGTETPSTFFKVRFVGELTGYNLLITTSNGSFDTGSVLPTDTYTVTVYSGQLGVSDSLGQVLFNRTIVVESGESTVVNFDFLEVPGLVSGNLYIDDSMAGGYIQFCSSLQTDPCSVDTNNNNSPFDVSNGQWYSFNTIGINNSFIDQGGFKIAIAPGNYRVHMITLNRTEVSTVPITVVSGTTNNVIIIQQ